MFAKRNPSGAVAAGESPTAEDAYEPSPLASSTRHRTNCSVDGRHSAISDLILDEAGVC
jgi:hypothetical protein